ncbi:phosphatase PAP2 family protein [Zwartia sp.]|uniref:phosphatase PAP2 family protein n=1 Tax=Zwartia sp. TaxID=2978004 RepID=UPI0027286ECE|nr:phosphatase PAP2 family protein [Zwartia sp.]MDO9023593.1 phosphatase PAP2 family protein [Zwartia sp.]
MDNRTPHTPVANQAGVISASQGRDFLWCLIPLVLWLGLWLFAPEPTLFRSINQATQRLPDLFWVSFNMLGNGWGVFGFAVPLLVLAPRLLVAALCAGAISGVLSHLLKHSLEFPRPAAVLDPTSFYILGKQLTHFSMPSGHTLTAFAILSAFYFALPLTRRRAFLWLFLVATLAGIARIAVGAHWPADICGGAAVGMFSGAAGSYLTRRIPEHALAPQSWLMRIISGAALICIYILLTTTIDFPATKPVQYVSAAIASLGVLWFVWCSYLAPKAQPGK